MWQFCVNSQVGSDMLMKRLPSFSFSVTGRYTAHEKPPVRQGGGTADTKERFFNESPTYFFMLTFVCTTAEFRPWSHLRSHHLWQEDRTLASPTTSVLAGSMQQKDRASWHLITHYKLCQLHCYNKPPGLSSRIFHPPPQKHPNHVSCQGCQDDRSCPPTELDNSRFNNNMLLLHF